MLPPLNMANKYGWDYNTADYALEITPLPTQPVGFPPGE
jgi:hypothetical protein